MPPDTLTIVMELSGSGSVCASTWQGVESPTIGSTDHDSDVSVTGELGCEIERVVDDRPRIFRWHSDRNVGHRVLAFLGRAGVDALNFATRIGPTPTPLALTCAQLIEAPDAST